MNKIILDYTEDGHTEWCVCGIAVAEVMIDGKGYCKKHALIEKYVPPQGKKKAKRVSGFSQHQAEIGGFQLSSRA